MKKLPFLIILTLLITNHVFSQTPPERTWHFDKYKRKTTVKERWSESSSGLKNGDYLKYFKNGEREIYGHFINGKETGKWVKTYYYTSSLKTKIVYHYKEGKLHGSWVETSMDGKEVIEKGNYSNGNKHGDWIEFPVGLFTESGRVTGSYNNGKREGWWMNYRGYHHYQWTKSNDYKQYSLVKDNDYKQGYRTLFKDGEIIKVINDKGENEAEECGYKNCIWALGGKTSFKEQAVIKVLEDFLKDFPASKYSGEIKEELSAKRSAMNEKEKLAKNKAEALVKAKQGDAGGVKDYFGEYSKMYNLYYAVNHSLKDSKAKFKGKWSYASKNQNHKDLSAKHEREAEVFMAILKNASNPIVSESMKMWDDDGTSTIGQFEFEWSVESGVCLKWASKYYGEYHIRLYVVNDELTIKKYSVTGLKLYMDNKLVHHTTSNYPFEEFDNLSNDAKYALFYSGLIFSQEEILHDEFGLIIKHAHQLNNEHRIKCLKVLIERINTKSIKILETKYHDSAALATVYLSILQWEIGEYEKSIQTIQSSNSKYKKYNSLHESFQPCSKGIYMKSYIKSYINEEYDVHLESEKDYLKKIKKL